MLDDVREYGKDDAELSIQVIAFETDYVEREGRVEPRDKVVLGKIGDAQYRQEMWISRLSGERSDDPMIWKAIKPAYEAWKRGEEIVEEGTPLAAWGAIPPRAMQAYRGQGIRTVEILARLEDTALERMPLDARKHRDMARKFVEVANSDTTRMAQKAKEQDDEIAMLKAQLAEIQAQSAAKAPARKAAA